MADANIRSVAIIHTQKDQIVVFALSRSEVLFAESTVKMPSVQSGETL